MDDYLAGNPYLQGFDLPPEARSQHAMGSLANMLIGLGAGISQTGAAGQSGLAGDAPGAAIASNMMGLSKRRGLAGDWEPVPMPMHPSGGWEPDPVPMVPSTFDKAATAVNTGVNWLGTQFTKGATAALSAPDSIGKTNQAVSEWVGNKLGFPGTGQAIGKVLRHVAPNFGISPTNEQLNTIVFGDFGVPEVDAGDNPALTIKPPILNGGSINLGKALDVGAQAIPAMLGGPGGVAAKVVPAVTGDGVSELAGQATQGTPWEIPARLLAGVAGGYGGSKAVTPLPANLTAEQARLVGLAKEKGIPLTVGQETGRARGVESALARLPTSQGKMAALADKQNAAINSDALKQAGATGDRLDPTSMSSVIRNASNEFEAAKNASGNVRLDTDFFKALEGKVGAYLENTPPSNVAPVVENRARDFVDVAKTGTRELTGARYQEFRRRLNEGAQSVGDPGARRALKGMRSALDDAMAASVPAEQAAAWQEVRKNWANLKILTKSAAGGTMDSRNAGNLSPSALTMALRQRQGADLFSSTEGGLNDTARVASYLADTRPNSSTPQPLQMQHILTGGSPGALIGHMMGGPVGAAIGAGAGLVAPNVRARAMTGSTGFGWLRDYLANQQLATPGQTVARLPVALGPDLLARANPYLRERQ